MESDGLPHITVDYGSVGRLIEGGVFQYTAGLSTIDTLVLLQVDALSHCTHVSDRDNNKGGR